MTKLEEKLIELGYERYALDILYRKKINSSQIFIKVDDEEETIADYYIKSFIVNNGDLTNSTRAFNQMQKDLEVLKQCQD